MSKRIILASDHNGVALKERLHVALSAYELIDIGPFASSPSADYTSYAKQLCSMLSRSPSDIGILICGTGQGMSITANKHPHIRAALVHNDLSATKSREHNDANVLCLGAWIRSDNENINSTLDWLEAAYGEGRHVRRVELISPQRSNKLVFANGIFDILHSGHIEMLKWAASLGERLIVGINSDRATRILKGNTRPVNSELDRKAVLESLRFVDEVVIFDNAISSGIINEINPSIIVKGGEWLADDVRLRDHIPDHIAVKVFPLIGGYSTSKIIDRVKETC